MSEETGLLAAIIANPVDRVARLVYADWLEENGQEESRARMAMCLMLRMTRVWPWCMSWVLGAQRSMVWTLVGQKPAPIGATAIDYPGPVIYEKTGTNPLDHRKWERIVGSQETVTWQFRLLESPYKWGHATRAQPPEAVLLCMAHSQEVP